MNNKVNFIIMLHATCYMLQVSITCQDEVRKEFVRDNPPLKMFLYVSSYTVDENKRIFSVLSEFPQHFTTP